MPLTKIPYDMTLPQNGNTLQVANTQTGALITGATIIPMDDTIPQITEGIEVMTLAITPTSATNKLKIEVVAVISNNATSNWLTAALFQDSTASALAAATTFQVSANAASTVTFTHYMTAGTIAPTTFKVRVGCQNVGTTTFNGGSGVRFLGGAMASSITITEIKA